MAAAASAAQTRAARSDRAVTSYDVARHAGVSQSVVSRCFTDRGGVSQATRRKVLKAVEELGYRPNAIARSLISNRSNMFAVIIANMSFHPAFTAHLSECFSSRGMHVLLFTMDHEGDADRILDQVWQYRVDGVIAAVQLSRKHLDTLIGRKTPLVFLNRLYRDVPVNAVCCDQVEGERALMDLLLRAGHRRFGIITGPADSVVSSQRVEGALHRLGEAGVTDVVLAEGAFDYDSGKRALKQLVEKSGSLDAIICANDLMAIGAMDAARHDLGLQVPEQLSIVGFDGLTQARWSSYDLVTIRQPTRAMVEAAVDMLLARVANPDLGIEKRMFTGELVTGTSARLSLAGRE